MKKILFGLFITSLVVILLSLGVGLHQSKQSLPAAEIGTTVEDFAAAVNDSQRVSLVSTMSIAVGMGIILYRDGGADPDYLAFLQDAVFAGIEVFDAECAGKPITNPNMMDACEDLLITLDYYHYTLVPTLPD